MLEWSSFFLWGEIELKLLHPVQEMTEDEEVESADLLHTGPRVL